MPRFLLAISLALFASIALAGEAPAPDGQAGTTSKAGKAAAVVATQDSEAGTPHPAAVPARAATPHMPRWHSLLPGMIR